MGRGSGWGAGDRTGLQGRNPRMEAASVHSLSFIGIFPLALCLCSYSSQAAPAKGRCIHCPSLSPGALAGDLGHVAAPPCALGERRPPTYYSC